MKIVDVSIAEKLAQGFAVELRVVPGTGNGADIHQPLHPIRPQQLDKFIEAPVGMAHGENYRLPIHAFLLFIAIIGLG